MKTVKISLPQIRPSTSRNLEFQLKKWDVKMSFVFRWLLLKTVIEEATPWPDERSTSYSTIGPLATTRWANHRWEATLENPRLPLATTRRADHQREVTLEDPRLPLDDRTTKQPAGGNTWRARRFLNRLEAWREWEAIGPPTARGPWIVWKIQAIHIYTLQILLHIQF